MNQLVHFAVGSIQLDRTARGRCRASESLRRLVNRRTLYLMLTVKMRLAANHCTFPAAVACSLHFPFFLPATSLPALILQTFGDLLVHLIGVPA